MEKPQVAAAGGRAILPRPERRGLSHIHGQKLANGLAEPFVFLVPAAMRSWKGERPMQIEWTLAEAMPEWLYRGAAVLAR